MEGIFKEFENENGLRSYPFAEGCVDATGSRAIEQGLFVDAMIYPVNPRGIVYLSEVSSDGTFVVSDDTGAILSGRPSGNLVEFFDNSAFARHVGTLIASSADALDRFAGRGESRIYSKSETAFSARCVFPVVLDGVTSINVSETGDLTGNVSFANGNSDAIRVSSARVANGGSTLRFDVLPRPAPKNDSSIRRIICVVDGETPFRIEKLAYNVVLLRLEGIDREAVCASVHREDAFEMADTCSCEKVPDPIPEKAPDTYQIEEVFIPPTSERPEGAENAFYLVPANVTGSVNPISITLEDGVVLPNIDGPEIVENGLEAELADGSLVDTVTSKGVVIQVPGLSGGQL